MADDPRYYTAGEVNAMLLQMREELIEYINKQIVMGTANPDPKDTSLFIQVTKTDS